MLVGIKNPLMIRIDISVSQQPRCIEMYKREMILQPCDTRKGSFKEMADLFLLTAVGPGGSCVRKTLFLVVKSDALCYLLLLPPVIEHFGLNANI